MMRNNAVQLGVSKSQSIKMKTCHQISSYIRNSVTSKEKELFVLFPEVAYWDKLSGTLSLHNCPSLLVHVHACVSKSIYTHCLSLNTHTIVNRRLMSPPLEQVSLAGDLRHH